MTQKSLALLVQSARDALKECLVELGSALEAVDALEEEGENTPVPSGDLERIIAQCQGAHRKLDQWSARL